MSSKKKSCYASSSFWIYVVFVLGLLFLELTHCMFDKNEESENRFLRRQLLEEDTVAVSQRLFSFAFILCSIAAYI